MDILHLVDRLEELFNDSRAIPFTHNVVVDEDRMLELIDQMTRQHCGGEMGRAMQRSDQPNRDFIRQRMGDEMSLPAVKTRRTIGRRLSRVVRRLRKHAALAADAVI